MRRDKLKTSMLKVGTKACLWWLLAGCASATPATKSVETPRQSAAVSPPGTPAEKKPLAAVPESPARVDNPISDSAGGAEMDLKSDAAPTIPEKCALQGKYCLPPPGFARKLCHGKFPSLALLMFEKHAPWSHLYVRAEELEPVNAYGGPRSDSQLQFGEEVILLKSVGQEGRSGIQVSSASDVDILRMDGTCATVRQEMLVGYVPGAGRAAPIVWKFLDDATQQALLENPQVKRAAQLERRDCRGMSVTHSDEQCAKSTKALNDAIILALRKGVALPQPAKLPAWASAEN